MIGNDTTVLEYRRARHFPFALSSHILGIGDLSFFLSPFFHLYLLPVIFAPLIDLVDRLLSTRRTHSMRDFGINRDPLVPFGRELHPASVLLRVFFALATENCMCCHGSPSLLDKLSKTTM